MEISYVVSVNFISIVIDNVPYNINKSHYNFDLIKQKLNEEDYENIVVLINEKDSLKKAFEDVDLLRIEGNNIFYKDEVIHGSLINQIIETKNQGYKFDNLLKFLENLMLNTDDQVRNELYDWIETSGCISITNDGAFLAYKKVKSDYMDIYTGTFDNSVGNICSMNKDAVDMNRNNVCSKGLHFCSYDYLTHYGSNDGSKVVIVKIFPQDVVSIPIDYSFQKGRCWKYEVVGEVENWKDEEFLTKPVDDYEAIDDDVEAESVKFSNVNEFISTLKTSEMTDFYNIFYKKSIKHLRTKEEAIEQMWKIYNADPSFFDEFI